MKKENIIFVITALMVWTIVFFFMFTEPDISAYTLTKDYCDRCNKETETVTEFLVRVNNRKHTRDGYRKEMDLCISCRDVVLKYMNLFTIKMSSPPRNSWEQEYMLEKLRKLSEDL